jgi:hypothetical protein
MKSKNVFTVSKDASTVGPAVGNVSDVSDVLSKERPKKGIIQSRGLGDIIMSLPIAKYYYDQGFEVVWPVCAEFYPSLVNSAPYITWVGIEADEAGKFFVETPLLVFQQEGVDPNTALYLYHYLNTQPQMTDPELFNILKFDQYKYQVAGLPFNLKWTLASCIVRDLDREAAFKASLNLPERYALVHSTGSSFKANIDRKMLGFIDPAVVTVEITADKTDSVFDWLSVIEGAEHVICIDSVFANLIDCMNIQGPKLYWMRRSQWDLTPVLGNAWNIIRSNLPIVEPKRVDPAVEAKALMDKVAAFNAAQQKQAQIQATDNNARQAAAVQKAMTFDRPSPVIKKEQINQSNQNNQSKHIDPGKGSSVVSHVPFATKGKVPTSFMHAVKTPPKSGVQNVQNVQFDKGGPSMVNPASKF